MPHLRLRPSDAVQALSRGPMLTMFQGRNDMNASSIMRLIATICFVLAMFGVSPGAVAMIPLGLALWCGSTLVP